MTKADKEGRRKAPILRFKGFTDDWEQRQLNEVTTRVLRKNKNLTSKRPLTISSQYGLIDQQAFFNKQVASSNLENYLLLEKGEFAYNKSYSDGFPYGTIKKLNLYENGAVSTLYIAFKANADINSDFLENLFSSNKWNNEVYKIAAEGARNHGLLNISPNDFFNIKITISKDSQEQAFISKFLRVFDNLLALYERKLKLLSQVKKYFLDNLFAEKEYPNLRFKGFTDAWEKIKLKDTQTTLTDGNYANLYPKPADMTDADKGIPFLTGGNLKNGILDLENAKYITKEKHSQLKSGHLEEDDIVIAVRGSLGELGYVTKQNIDWNINSQLAIIRTSKNELIGKFLLYFFLSSKGKSKLLSRQTGTALKQLPLQQLKTIVVPKTLLLEQQKISNILKTIDKTISFYKGKQQHFAEIKNTLLNTMFI